MNADIPDKTYLKIDVRTGDTEELLTLTPWQGPFGPYPPRSFPLDLTKIPAMDGKFLQVHMWLFSQNKEATPEVKSLKVKFSSD